MRNTLAAEIKHRLGIRPFSKGWTTLKKEIVQNALDRYDEEIQNGASEQEAYRIALDSVGDIREFNRSDRRIDPEKRSRIISCSVVGTIVAALLALCLFITIKTQIYYPSRAFQIWLLFFATAGLLLLIAYGVLRLLLRRPKVAIGIIMIVVGVHLIVYPAFIMLILGVQTGNDHFDYTDRIDEIASIALVECEAYDPKTGTFEYTELKTLLSDQYEQITAELADLRYSHYYGHPFFLQKGTQLILIRFSSAGKDGTIYAFYSRATPGYGKIQEDGQITASYRMEACDSDPWDALIRTYFP